MEQHPVPQQISSYQFRLVGDMTLKQFFQVAGGALISLLIYATGLPALIKWPLIIFFALLGVALAFLPFEERPLEQWILAFFRSAYSPTIFNWKKTTTPPSYFQSETAQVPAPGAEAPSAEKAETAAKPGLVNKLEEAETAFFANISSFLGHPTKVTPTPTPATGPMAAPPTSQPQGPVPVPEVKPTPYLATATASYQKPKTPPPPVTIGPVKVAQTLKGQAPAGAQPAQFSTQAAPPHPPTQANTIVGQVLDSAGKVVEGAILEVKDEMGRPVRALRTNKVGHFIIVTPLLNGKYEAVIEKEGLKFDPVVFEAKGEIIPALAIKSKGAQA